MSVAAFRLSVNLLIDDELHLFIYVFMFGFVRVE